MRRTVDSVRGLLTPLLISLSVCLSPCLLLLPVAAANAGTPVVYHSPGDDGSPQAMLIHLPLGGPQTLHLYGDGGSVASTSGTLCDDGSGEEVCGWDVLVEGRGGLLLTAFRPEPGIFFVQTSTDVRFLGGNHLVGTLGAVKLGELDFDSSVAGSIFIAGGQVVGAALQESDLPAEEIIRVPEPAMVPGLLAGTALLGALRRSRSQV